MMVFSYSGTQLILPSPDLGNTETIDLRSVYHRAMDGTIYGYKLGPALRTHEYSFSNMNRPKVLEAITFLRTSAGQTILLTDHDNVIWTGKILNYPMDFTHQAIRDNRFRLVFEGKQNG